MRQLGTVQALACSDHSCQVVCTVVVDRAASMIHGWEQPIFSVLNGYMKNK